MLEQNKRSRNLLPQSHYKFIQGKGWLNLDPCKSKHSNQLSEMRYIIILRLLTHMMMLTLMLNFPLPLGKVHVNAHNTHCLKDQAQNDEKFILVCNRWQNAMWLIPRMICYKKTKEANSM